MNEEQCRFKYNGRHSRHFNWLPLSLCVKQSVSPSQDWSNDFGFEALRRDDAERDESLLRSDEVDDDDR